MQTPSEVAAVWVGQMSADDKEEIRDYGAGEWRMGVGMSDDANGWSMSQVDECLREIERLCEVEAA